jgi:hypothetical protein
MVQDLSYLKSYGNLLEITLELVNLGCEDAITFANLTAIPNSKSSKIYKTKSLKINRNLQRRGLHQA